MFDNPDRITVGNALDVVVAVRCISSSSTLSGSGVNWTFGENDTAVPTGLKAFGTSQDDSGTLRVYPANILSPSGTRFQCREIGNGQILNVTLELRKPITLEHQNDYLNSISVFKVNHLILLFHSLVKH